MSGLTTKAALETGKIKKNFPDAGALLSQLTGNITTTYSAAAPYKQTDTTGIKELVITIPSSATAGAGAVVSFDAPSDAVATAWFANASTNSVELQYVFVPHGTSRSFTFSSAITRWDYKAVGATVTVYEERVR